MGSLLASLFGCGPDTFEDVLEGRIALAEEEKAAVSQLLAQSGDEPAALRVFADGEAISGSPPLLRLEDGSVETLGLDGLSDAAPLGTLGAARDLRLRGRFEDFSLDGLPALESLSLLDSGESLRHLELHDLPRLRRLVVDGARLGAVDLSDLPALESLALTSCGLEKAPRLEAPALRYLSLSGNRLDELASLPAHPQLETLHLSRNRLRSLRDLPELPSLRTLNLADNPLEPETRLDPRRLPALKKIDLRRTALDQNPEQLAMLAEIKGLERLEDREVSEEREFLATLERLRLSFDEAPGERVTEVGSTSGQARGAGGRCQWRTSPNARARVSCRLTYDSLSGLTLARLGSTDPAMPFKGGGAPRLRATLKVTQGEAWLYVHEDFDLVALARQITSFDEERAEANRREADRFDGYRRLLARPGEPATLQGDAVLLGSRVALVLEAGSEGARGLELEVEPQ